MQATGRRPDQLVQPRLDIHMNVLEFAFEREPAALYFGENVVEAARDGLAVLDRNNALFGEHLGMRLAGGDVLPEQAPVDIDRGVDLRHDCRRLACEASTPHFIAHGRSSNPLMTVPPPQKPLRPSRRTLVVGGVSLLAAVAVVGAVYGLRGFARNPEDAACQSAADLARRLAPLARGELAALVIADPPRRLPPLDFKDAAGKPKSLADWRGRTVLLNLWATWCVPCRKEMPALDALQRQLGGPGFEVVAVNIDTRDPEKPKAWLAEAGVKDLAYYADPSAKSLSRNSRPSARRSACRRLWLSIRQAAKSPPSPVRPNGRAATPLRS